MYAIIVSVALTSFFPDHMIAIREHEVAARATVFGTNLLSGCLTGGIGAVLNDGKFSKGCVGGLLGGGVYFAGQMFYSVAEIQKGAGAAGKIVTSLGSSAIANSATNRGIFDRYMIGFGPLDLTFEKGKGVNWSTSIMGVGAIISFAAVQGGKLDIGRTLANLTPVFYSNGLVNPINGSILDGMSSGGSIMYNSQLHDRFGGAFLGCAVSHELIHVGQWSSYIVYNDAWTWNHIGLGRDVAWFLGSAMSSLNATYFYSPTELEAYAMEQRVRIP